MGFEMVGGGSGIEMIGEGSGIELVGVGSRIEEIGGRSSKRVGKRSEMREGAIVPLVSDLKRLKQI